MGSEGGARGAERHIDQASRHVNAWRARRAAERRVAMRKEKILSKTKLGNARELSTKGAQQQLFRCFPFGSFSGYMVRTDQRPARVGKEGVAPKQSGRNSGGVGVYS